MTDSPDPWAPWENADPDALADALDHETFDAQVRALLDLAPKASAANILALPVWPEKHTKTEVKAIRDAWAFTRGSKREIERERDELPLEQSVNMQFQHAARSGDWKSAKEAFDLMTKIQGSKLRDTGVSEDDFSRLSDLETLVLAAILHKLRDEPMTEFDQHAVTYINALGAEK